MVWHRLFHAVVWTETAIGIAMLWRAMKRSAVLPSGRAFIGSILIGWGLFLVFGACLIAAG